jgi:hypothetical protein
MLMKNDSESPMDINEDATPTQMHCTIDGRIAQQMNFRYLPAACAGIYSRMIEKGLKCRIAQYKNQSWIRLRIDGVLSLTQLRMI